MKQMLSRIMVLSIILVYLLQTGCKKDTISTGSSNSDANNLEINQFIWYGMHNYYLWVDNVPKLSVSQYSNETALNSFLNGYTDHEKLFNDLLYQKDVIDKWSFIFDDYTVLDSLLSGISKTNGMDFGLVLYDNVKNYVLGYVKYVAKGSPAEIAGIKRGDIFTKVNNQQITTSNYQDLLFNEDTYTLSFAQIVNHTVQPTTRTVSVTAVEFQEDPVLFDSIYTVDSHKVGYLVYNGFTPDFDLELNNSKTTA